MNIMKKIIGKFAVAVFALSAFWGSQANAALIGVTPSDPDMNLTFVSTNYDATGANGLFSIGFAAFSNYTDASHTLYGTGAINVANTFINATIDKVTGAVISGSYQITGTIAGLVDSEQVLLAGGLTQIGGTTDGTFDMLGTVTGGALAPTHTGGAGFIFTNAAANDAWTGSWDDSFSSSFASSLDLTTPEVPGLVSAPAPILFVLLGSLMLLRRSRK